MDLVNLSNEELKQIVLSLIETKKSNLVSKIKEQYFTRYNSIFNI